MSCPKNLKSLVFFSTICFGLLAIWPARALAPVNLPDGLRIIDTQLGTGREAVPGTTVTVNYTGYLYASGARGAKFDSSADHGQTFSFVLGNHEVIPGWEEGMAGMKVGGKRSLIVPPELGYADKPTGGIGAWSTLYFDIELLKVSDPHSKP